MHSLSNGAGFRTVLMVQPRADRFAQMLRKNARFTGVAVHQSDRAKGERRYFVSYRPSSEGRMQSLLGYHQGVQDARGENQAENYVVVRDTDNPGGYWLANLTNGETYQVHMGRFFDCDCPQHLHRTRGAGLECKHAAVVRTHLRLGLVEEFTPATPVLSREAIRARMAQDFPDF